MHISSQPLLEDIYSVAFGCSQKKVTEIVVSRMEKRERESRKEKFKPQILSHLRKSLEGGCESRIIDAGKVLETVGCRPP